MLLNLAGNAIKFTETGGVSVVVEQGEALDEIVFRVRDTGIGIAPEQRARIFLEFEQAEGGSGRKFGGSGLGLAISRRIVERMDGRIAVDSAPGQGSTFRFAIALPRVDAAPAFAVPNLSGKTVLVVAPPSLEAALLERRLTRWRAAVTRTECRLPSPSKTSTRCSSTTRWAQRPRPRLSNRPAKQSPGASC